ncbi:phosphate acyltransferase PlsX [bacterium]|nr:phosphate acyltransferase PlsX [bacterium]
MPAIAVDAMGGEHGPEAVVQGVAAVSRQTDIDCVLVGDEARLQPLLEATAYNPERIAILHASEAIGLQEEPRAAVRYKRNKASLFVCLREVAQGRCAAAVSAGNPGAAIAAALRELTLLPGVGKAALASVYPRAAEGPEQDTLALALDVGATVRCNADELVRFAVMGSTYARVISRVAEPRVALLNMGRDPLQGDETLTAAHRRLRDLPGINFVGNIEGHELTSGRADVVVCEGLLGNIVLKLLESVANMAVDLTSSAAQRTWRWRAGMAIMASGADRLRALADYASYGGAPILGFEQVFIKAHARSQAPAIANTVKVAAKAARDGLIPALRDALAPLADE